MPRVKIIHTGGTLGMVRRDGNWRPESDLLAGLLETLPELKDPELPEWDLVEFRELLDSSNVGPSEWERIAGAVLAWYDDFDGFVVIHGTDTMAYTASALSFMLEGLQKPVILTGAQLPLVHPRTDARENLTTSLLLAGTSDIPEVCIYFNGRLLRGNRATKTDTSSYIAFDSPNLRDLGDVGVVINLHREMLCGPDDRGTGGLHVATLGRSVVGAFRLFPGVQAKTLRSLLAPPLQGLVLECFGTGNAPNKDPELLAAIREATDRGVVVVVVSQCSRGAVDLGQYEVGASLALAGVTTGFDMTAECALAKLSYLLEREGLNVTDVRRLMCTPLRGELSLPGAS